MAIVLNTKRLGLPVAIALISLSSLAFGAKKKEEPLSSVADLRYGVTLYHYYQGDYFDALSELYVAKERGGISGHKDNPEIIEGGISLAFGMHETASDIFNRLLTEDRPAKVRNAAWLNLGKLAYQRGLWATANESINHMNTDDIRYEVDIERRALAVNTLIHLGDLAGAESALAELDAELAKKDPTAWPYYLHHNLASAYGRTGQFQQAITHYQQVYASELTEKSLEPDLQQALRDKAHTAAGFSLLALNQYQDAQQEFNQVRLTNGLANQALLGSGWAAYGQEKYADAIRPWQELLRRDSDAPEVQEAMLALPYVYEKMGAQGEALFAYLDAESNYEIELARIDEAERKLQDIDLLPLLNLEVDRNSTWLNTPDLIETPVINYLQRLVAKNLFQARVQELRDLTALLEELKGWEAKLVDYQDLISARIDQRLAQETEIRERNYAQIINDAVAQKSRIDAIIANIESNRDYLALITDADTNDLIDRAEKSVNTAKIAGDQVSARKAAQAKLFYGILYWNASQDYHDRIWELKEQSRQLETNITELKQSFAKVQDASTLAPDIAPMAVRLDDAQVQITDKQTRLSNLLTDVEADLKEGLLAELDSQKQRVRFYLAETKLSIARLYDTRPANGETILDTSKDAPLTLPQGTSEAVDE